MLQTVEMDVVPHVVSADEGDTPNSVLGVGYDTGVLERQAELEDLAELEMASDAAAGGDEPERDVPLPGEAEAQADAEATEAQERPAGVTGTSVVAARPASARWGVKVLRTFAFAFGGAFVTAALPIADQLAKGGSIDLSVTGSLLVAAVAGSIAAGARALVAVLPVFSDDAVGLRRPAARSGYQAP